MGVEHRFAVSRKDMRDAILVPQNLGLSGGKTCAPIAHDVYVALQQMERKASAKPAALAQAR